MTEYFWAKIELLGRRVRYGRCSVVGFLGTQLLRVEVPYPEPKQEQQSVPKYTETDFVNVHPSTLIDMCKREFGECEQHPVPWVLVNRLCDIRENVTVEQFESTEDFGAGAIYCRTILAEEQVREALKPWKAPVLVLPESTGDESLWDDDMPTPSPLANVLDRIECADWPATWTPGERVLLLASQGFLGVGRVKCGDLLEAIADKCMSDAEALRSLLHFQAHERADLPFPIRELLGINRDGDVCYGADDIDEYLRQTRNDDPFEGPSSEKDKADLAQAIQEVLTPEIERPATPTHKATTSDNGKTWSYEYHDTDGNTLDIRPPLQYQECCGAIAEFALRDGHWAPNATQLEVLYNRIGEILSAHKAMTQQMVIVNVPYELSPEFIAEANAMRDAIDGVSVLQRLTDLHKLLKHMETTASDDAERRLCDNDRGRSDAACGRADAFSTSAGLVQDIIAGIVSDVPNKP
jgi:hypothetical protein